MRYVFVDLDDEPSEHDERVLDQQELARARRFHHVRDRRRFIASHAALRYLLAGFLGVRPGGLRFQRNGHGKPRLSTGQEATGQESLEFNLSHSGGIGLLAVARDRSLGIDIEQLRDVPDALLVAEHHFAAAETEALRTFEPKERQLSFQRCWTYKEAMVKAIGEGLARPLGSVELQLTRDTAALHRLDGLSAAQCGWTLASLPAPTGYLAAGAVATEPGEPPPRWKLLEQVPDHEWCSSPLLELQASQ